MSDWVLSFPSGNKEDVHKNMQHTNTYTLKWESHARQKMEREQAWNRCCWLKDAAPAYMLKLALNVWITHRSSQRLSRNSLQHWIYVVVCLYPVMNKPWWICNSTSALFTKQLVDFKQNNTFFSFMEKWEKMGYGSRHKERVKKEEEKEKGNEGGQCPQS